jgi:CubicO group peptidase (beta-lactamase class C family)
MNVSHGSRTGAFRVWAVSAAVVACAPQPQAETAPAAIGVGQQNTNPLPVTSPSPVGDSPEVSARGRAIAAAIAPILDKAVRDSVFPGAIAVVGTRAGLTSSVAVGRLDWKESAMVDIHTIWDVASLTKVVGMTSAMMQLVERGLVDLDAPAKRYLPLWTAPRTDGITVRHLLTHSSGLPSWRALYKEAQTPAEAMAAVYATAPDTVPGARYVYSDLGAILLGEIVSNVTREKLDTYLEKNIFGPLKMVDTRYRPSQSLRARIAPTEYDPWRQRLVHGEVHDENAFMLGGVSGHAGLFSTADDLARFARMYLGEGELDGVRIVQPATIVRFTHVQDSTRSHRALGWETANGTNSGGHFMTKRAFGHTGFTGTSFWVDPGRDLFVILLTNSVNPTREKRVRVGPVRIAVADAVARALDPSLPPPSAR